MENVLHIFFDDVKVFCTIKSQDDLNRLQTDVDNLVDWSVKWQIKLNISKCQVFHIGKKTQLLYEKKLFQ